MVERLKKIYRINNKDLDPEPDLGAGCISTTVTATTEQGLSFQHIPCGEIELVSVDVFYGIPVTVCSVVPPSTNAAPTKYILTLNGPCS